MAAMRRLETCGIEEVGVCAISGRAVIPRIRIRFVDENRGLPRFAQNPRDSFSERRGWVIGIGQQHRAVSGVMACSRASSGNSMSAEGKELRHCRPGNFGIEAVHA